jgi:hypothetical protein
MTQQEAMDIAGCEFVELHFPGTEAFLEKAVNGGPRRS